MQGTSAEAVGNPPSGGSHTCGAKDTPNAPRDSRKEPPRSVPHAGRRLTPAHQTGTAAPASTATAWGPSACHRRATAPPDTQAERSACIPTTTMFPPNHKGKQPRDAGQGAIDGVNPLVERLTEDGHAHPGESSVKRKEDGCQVEEGQGSDHGLWRDVTKTWIRN